MRGLFDFCRRDDLPAMSRPNYTYELRHMMAWGVFSGIVEGNTASIVVAKTFEASTLLITVVWATPMLANMLSLLWGVLARSAPKKISFILLALAASASLATVAFAPSDWKPWGGWVFASQLALARIFLAGLINIRTSVWSANYPTEFRARIAGRLQTLRFLMGLFSTAAVSLLFDAHAELYRVVYPAIALVGVLSLWPYRRVRIRGEARELALVRAHLQRGHAAGTGHGLWNGLRESAAILRKDRAFAQYCSAQFLLGSSNFMVDPVLAIVITRDLQMGYFASSLLLDHIPTVVMLLTIAPWSRLFDRVGVLHFRVINSVYWGASAALAALAMLLMWGGGEAWLWPTVGVLAVSRAVNGVGRAGGSIAWNLGHLHFSNPAQEELYMGIHVALTGFRGLFVPFLGVLAFQWIGWGSFLLALGLCLVSYWMFRRLAHQQERSEHAAAIGSKRGEPVAIAVASDGSDLVN